MKNYRLLRNISLIVLVGAAVFVHAQNLAAQDNAALHSGTQLREKRILYFNPEVYPDIADIREPTNTAFFSTVSDNLGRSSKMLRADVPIEFDSVDTKSIAEYCKNNGADYAIVPKVKYFKVGIGKYIFSNQVIVSMKLFDSSGNFITETDYDTYKKNIRLLGSAENSVKIGTKGAYRALLRNLREKLSEN